MGKFSSSSTYPFVVFAILISIGQGSEASCYFPAAFQGEYVTQAIMSGVPTISYSTLSVLFDSIPVWGICHKRIGNNVILMDDTGGLTCYKCFNLVLRSSNVLQIHTAGLDKCYTTEERAIADCLGPQHFNLQKGPKPRPCLDGGNENSITLLIVVP